MLSCSIYDSPMFVVSSGNVYTPTFVSLFCFFGFSLVFTWSAVDVGRSQSRTVLSSDPLANRSPSQDHRTVRVGALCSRNDRRIPFVLTSITFKKYILCQKFKVRETTIHPPQTDTDSERENHARHATRLAAVKKYKFDPVEIYIFSRDGVKAEYK